MICLPIEVLGETSANGMYLKWRMWGTCLKTPFWKKRAKFPLGINSAAEDPIRNFFYIVLIGGIK